jgi:hypothetical protein
MSSAAVGRPAEGIGAKSLKQCAPSAYAFGRRQGLDHDGGVTMNVQHPTWV